MQLDLETQWLIFNICRDLEIQFAIARLMQSGLEGS